MDDPIETRGRPSSSLVFIVGRMEGKLDQFLSNLTTLEGRTTTNENSIQSLQVWRGYVNGGAAVVVFIITAWEVIRYVYHF